MLKAEILVGADAWQDNKYLNKEARLHLSLLFIKCYNRSLESDEMTFAEALKAARLKLECPRMRWQK